jgi:hypothetical protein
MFQEQNAISVHQSYHDYEEYLESYKQFAIHYESEDSKKGKFHWFFHIVELILLALTTMV